MADDKPWEKYANQGSAEEGPWSKYADPALLTSATGTQKTQGPTMGDQIWDATKGAVMGAGKGLAHTANEVMSLVNKIPVGDERTRAERSEGIKAADKMFTPEGTAEKVGFGGEQIGEWLIPTGAEEKAGLFATKMLPKLGKWAAPLARILAGSTESAVRNKMQGGDLGSGALMGAGSGVVGETGRVVAPKLAESALGITNRMRGRGRTIGKAVLDEIKGVTPAMISTNAGEKISTLTSDMETAVRNATQQGARGTTQPAHDVLDAAIENTPRNARELRDKLASLRGVLTLTGVGGSMAHTPEELLEIKRGIGKTIQTWPPEWQRIGDVQRVQQALYGAIDKEIDRLVPGNAGLNQRISSLIPAKKAAQKIETSASLPQKVAHRMLAHTGALMGAGAGGAYGYREGGLPGAIVGGVSGLVVPELMASPTAQMAAARVVKSPKTVQLGRGMASRFMRRGSSVENQARSEK